MNAVIGGVLTLGLRQCPTPVGKPTSAVGRRRRCPAPPPPERRCHLAARESSPIRVRWARISAWAALSASSASNVVTALYVVRTDLMSVKLLKQDLLRATRGWEASRSGRRSQYRGFRRLFPFRNRQRSATALTSLRSWSRTQACRVRRDTENHAGQRIWRCQQATST